MTSNCIYNRENRMGIDRVKDDVETRLYQESGVIKNTQNKLKDALNSVLIIAEWSTPSQRSGPGSCSLNQSEHRILRDLDQ